VPRLRTAFTAAFLCYVLTKGFLKYAGVFSQGRVSCVLRANYGDDRAAFRTLAEYRRFAEGYQFGLHDGCCLGTPSVYQEIHSILPCRKS
jgi:hypothetical protein